LALFTQFINSFRFFCIYTTTNHNTDCSGKINFAAVRNYLNFCEENNRPKLSSSLKTIEIQAVKNKKLKQRKKLEIVLNIHKHSRQNKRCRERNPRHDVPGRLMTRLRWWGEFDC